MNLPFHPRDDALLEQHLRAGAHAFAPAPPPELRGRILAALRSTPRIPLAAPRERLGTWIAAAAALLVLVSAWWLTHRPAASLPRSTSVVAFSRGLLGAGTRVLALPGQAEDNLRLEAEKLLDDGTRVAVGLVRGLPAPLRAKLERM